MTIAKPTIAVKRTRSVEWTPERISALGTAEVCNLRANSKRLNDPEIMQRCDAVLGERKRARRSSAVRSGSGVGKRPLAKASSADESA